MMATRGMRSRAQRVVRQERVAISAIEMMAVTKVVAKYMIPGPTMERTASMSLVARAIRSPVLWRWKKPAERRWRWAR